MWQHLLKYKLKEKTAAPSGATASLKTGIFFVLKNCNLL